MGRLARFIHFFTDEDDDSGGGGGGEDIKTVAGEILAVTDAANEKPRSIVVEIPYRSSGVSSFTMRWRRRNMLDLTGTTTSAGIKYTPQSNGLLLANGTATGNSRYGFYGSYSYISDNNTYNLPKGSYTAFYYNVTSGSYVTPMHIYKGTTTTKISDVSGLQKFTNSTSQSGRVALQYASGVSLSNAYFKAFLAFGDAAFEDWDKPATSRSELTVSLGKTIYGGTVDLTNGKVISRYASDGTELPTPEESDITVTVPTLYEGANTIWASLIGSSLTMTYLAADLKKSATVDIGQADYMVLTE